MEINGRKCEKLKFVSGITYYVNKRKLADGEKHVYSISSGEEVGTLVVKKRLDVRSGKMIDMYDFVATKKNSVRSNRSRSRSSSSSSNSTRKHAADPNAASYRQPVDFKTYYSRDFVTPNTGSPTHMIFDTWRGKRMVWRRRSHGYEAASVWNPDTLSWDPISTPLVWPLEFYRNRVGGFLNGS